ncbi:hypothetical protein TNIN_3881 [Trichonephila inaurata madagascariensis]|uniref:Uncharacterized protein n=1 Tax=Trichonephila inaurata madagascariensis TaxID=2747483 RepID=A0A8X6XYY0_9ARAC|nr:hypothetical protein TNIN_3881 [Trichonephila inaurata madagascariensis]
MKKAFHRRHRLPSTNPNPSILLNPLPEVVDSKIKIYFFKKKQKVSSSFTHGASSRMVISELNSNRSNNEGIVNFNKKIDLRQWSSMSSHRNDAGGRWTSDFGQSNSWRSMSQHVFLHVGVTTRW